jgi:pimeloyl-ACP methyl ester carboxylesterase
MAISMGREETTPRFWRWDTTKYVFTIPAKLLTTPLIDSLGQAAWDNMSRRTVTLFESPIYPRIHKSDADQMNYLLDYGPPGDLQIFLNRLRKHIADHGGDDAYDITIIGHSMGTMVINELLRHNPDLKIHNIVYMAAACTIHDFAKTTVPYLKAHAETQFYNLCLHPTCEITEAEYYELPPRGSLLLWIDEFLANPQTSLDRTLGRWDNILPAMYVIPDKIRDRVTIKAFAMTSNGSLSDPATGNSPAPQKHGDFTEVSYYVDSFWKARPADDKNLEGLVAQMDRRLQDVETSLPESRRLKLRNDTSATTRPVEKN